jgi:hypothetical protein
VYEEFRVPARYTFFEAKRWLRRKFPLNYPVRVRLVGRAVIAKHHLDAVGCSIFCSSGCVILIDRSASADNRIEHLHEEWAHLLRWHLPLDSEAAPDEHDAIYDLIHGRIKRAWNTD